MTEIQRREIVQKCNALGEYSEEDTYPIIKEVLGKEIQDLTDQERESLAESLF
jgi:hypothetical protein